MGGIAVRVLLSSLGVSLVLAGCGKVSQNKPDAGNTDDAGNTTIDASPLGEATVVTEAALIGGMVGAKVGSIDIVSNLPDNSMQAAAKTDASGSATIKVFAGGSVTAIYHHTADLGADLITWVGVKPGDVLTFGSRNFAPSTQADPSLGSQTYAWPGLAGASQYKVFTACNNKTSALNAPAGALSVAGQEFGSCHRDPMTVLFTALDASNALIDYGVVTVQKFTSGTTVQLGAWNSTAQALATVNLTGLPAEVASVSGNFRVVADPLTDFNPSVGYSGAVTGGAFTVSNLGIAQGVGLRALGAVDLGRGGTFRVIHVLDAIALDTLTQTVAAPVLPPWSQTRTTASAGSRTASWLLVTSAASVHKGQVLHMTWNHTVAGAPSPSQWDIIMPPGQASFAFPTFPAPLSDSEPAANDTLSASTRVFDIPSVTGYDMLRATPSANVMCLECSVRTGDFRRVVYTDTL
jgi:hypothetical protein